jgi:hypothetical protein
MDKKCPLAVSSYCNQLLMHKAISLVYIILQLNEAMSEININKMHLTSSPV